MKLPNWTNGFTRYFLYTILFYSLYPVAKLLGAAKFDLLSFPGRMIGEATYEGVDIASRIWLFYKCVGSYVLMSAVLIFIARWILNKFQKLPNEIIIINHLSLIGLSLYILKMFDFQISQGIDLVYYLHKAALVALVLQILLFKNKPFLKKQSVTLFVTGLLFGVAVYTAIAQFHFAVFHQKVSHNSLNFFIYGVAFVYMFFAMVIPTNNYMDGRSQMLRLLRAFFPLMLCLFLPMLIDETYMYFNNHYIFFIAPIRLLLFYGVMFVGWSVYVFVNPKKEISLNPEQYVGKYYLPMIFAAAAVIIHYNPFIVPSGELFELANRILPVSEFFRFGVIPFVEKFNSHLLSETIFGFIYTCLYGLKSQEMIIYDFMYPVIHLVICGIFLYRYTRSIFATIFVVMILPAFSAIIPDYFSITLLSVFVLKNVIEKPDSYKNYMLFFTWLSFMVLWRIDLGYPVIIASLFVLITYRVGIYRHNFNFLIFIKSALMFLGGLFVLLFFVSMYRGFNIWEALSNELNYLSSSQSYGTKTLGQTWIREFKYHHFILPLVAVIIAGSIFLKFKQRNVSGQQRLVTIAMLFMIVFYFVNFQRGLVRHGFAEGVDLFMSSHIFLILAGSSYLFLHHRSQLQRLVVFSLIAFASSLYLKFPASGNTSIELLGVLHKIEHRPLIYPQNHYLVRCNEDDYFKFSTYQGVKKFVDENISPSQTFGDFSNTPMLYYYTKRECPGYFPQNVLSVHNDKMQDDAIVKMKQYDIPYVIMQHLYDNWWDHTDGVDNTVRHYRLAEYFYLQYEPWSIVQNNYIIWKRKNFSDKPNAPDTLFQHSGKLNLIQDSVSCRYSLPDTIRFEQGGKYLLQITYEKSKEFIDPVIHFYTRQHERDAVRLWAGAFNRYKRQAWFVYEPFEARTVTFSLEHPEKISSITLLKYDRIPDFTKDIPKVTNIQRLSYIWGNYDHKLDTSKKIVVKNTGQNLLNKRRKVRVALPADIDKSLGNYVLLNFNYPAETPEVDVKLTYGKDSTILGEFIFKVAEQKKKLPLAAIRISSQYAWVRENANWIELEYLANDKNSLLVKEIAILAGD